MGVTASRIAGNPRGSSYRRANLDWYVEPRSATKALLAVEKFRGEVWDPACGSGNIVSTCREHGLVAWGSDVERRGYDFGQTVDFLRDEHRPVDNIICNPPFSISLDFAKKALTLATRKVAFVQRLCWLEGQKRAAFLESSPLARVHIFRNRICMPPGEKKDSPAKGGFIAYAWFVWEHGLVGPATVHWLTAKTDDPFEGL